MHLVPNTDALATSSFFAWLRENFLFLGGRCPLQRDSKQSQLLDMAGQVV